MYFLGSCLHSCSNMWENTVYQKNIVFTLFFKPLTISNHRSFCQKTRRFTCCFRPLFYSTVLKAQSYMICSQMWFWTPVCAPRGIQNATTGAPFSPKRPQRCSTFSRPEHPAADPKPTWARPAAQNARGYVFIDSGVDFGLILGSIFNNLGLISEQF